MQNLLLLHGAVGSAAQLEPVAELLQDSYKVYLLNLSGHGGKPVPSEQFSIEMFAEDTISLIEKGRLDNVNVFGYSMGGYVALYIAKHFPGKINKIFTTATKFDWNEETSLKESKLLDSEKILQKIPAFAEQLSLRHSPENWKKVLSKTAEMMINLGKNNLLGDEDFKLIENEVLLCTGDRDNMVSVEETARVFRKFKNGKLLILPDTPHPIEKYSVQRLAYEIKSFFR